MLLTLNHLQDDNCMQLLFLPFHKWSLRSAVCLSQLCQRRSLILAHLAVCFIRLKETPHCRLCFPLTGKVFCCTKACVSRTAPYADQCERASSDPDTTDIVVHPCFMFCADAATLVCYER